jgi:hypothetical protein
MCFVSLLSKNKKGMTRENESCPLAGITWT